MGRELQVSSSATSGLISGSQPLPLPLSSHWSSIELLKSKIEEVNDQEAELLESQAEQIFEEDFPRDGEGESRCSRFERRVVGNDY